MAMDLYFTSKFKKDLKRCKKQGKNLTVLREVIEKLRSGEALDERYHDHKLTGSFIGHHECHIESDFLLIYKIDEKNITLTAVRLGSHSEILSL